ncbi:MAG: PIN domain-containing protein [Pseudomonadales bacterium]|nr:PIN domain-containing protein [Candidatus Woesebacteria bacterium]MCB9801977.1 PIN domain-containing protein [Pseudomonadales bacterium]
MIILDTNVLIRYFINDDVAIAKKVEAVLQTAEHLHIPAVVFPEIEYVLLKLYDSTRDAVGEAFSFLCSLSNVKVDLVVQQAVVLYKKTNLDMADCIVACSGRQGDLIASLDRALVNNTNMEAY